MMTEYLEYPSCARKEGEAKVDCLIRRIIYDYKHGGISKRLAIRRMVYLIALNKRNEWVSMTEIRHKVKKGLERLKRTKRD